MADSKDIDAPAANAAPDAGEVSAPSIAPALDEIAKTASSADANQAGATVEQSGLQTPIAAELITSANAGEGLDKAAAEESTWRWQWPGYPTLAAAVALAAAVGALAGAATTAGLLRDNGAAASNRALQAKVEKLDAEVAALKDGLKAAQRETHVQFGKLGVRLDHAEKMHSEPGAKIAKLAEGLERVERQMTNASAELVTGSIPIPVARPETRLAVADGWRLRDFFAGRALVQNRSGRMFEVAPGSNLPELGRVEAINRENGRVVVVTRNGIIAATLPQPRSMPRYRPYFD